MQAQNIFGARCSLSEFTTIDQYEPGTSPPSTIVPLAKQISRPELLPALIMAKSIYMYENAL
jgi:hypothetical protein